MTRTYRRPGRLAVLVAATAIGPCLRSAAEKAAVNSDVVSSIFSAASAAAP